VASVAYLPYSTVQPRPTPPEDYQNIPTRPAEFGAQVGAAEERLGAGASQASRVFGQIAADDQVNHVLTGLDDLTTQFQSLRGKDALDQQPAIRKQMSDLLASARGNLSTPEQLVEFDRQSRYLYSRADREVGLHADQQMQVWGIGVNKSGADLSLNGIGKAAQTGDQDAVANHTQDLTNFRMKEAELTYGQDLSPEIRQNVVRASQADSARSQVMAMLPTNPAAAKTVLDANAQNFNPLEYEALSQRLKGSLEKAQDDAIVHSIISTPEGNGGGQFRALPGAPIEGANPQEQQFLNEARHRESGGNYNIVGKVVPGGARTGAFQFADATWKEASQATGQGTQFVHAKDAPPAVQDANALWLYRNHGTKPWAASGPYPAPGTPPSLALVQPTTYTPLMQQPVPGFPTREELINRIPEGLSDEQYGRVYSGVNKQYNRMVQSTSADRAQTLEQYKGGLAMLQDGRDFNYDEGKIRSLFPSETANEMIGNLQDARTIGQQITSVRGMPLSEIVSQQAANRSILANSTGENYARQSRLAGAFDKAAEQHIKALQADPAGYVFSTNPDINVARQAISSETPEQTQLLRSQGQPSAAESYAVKMLGEQERLGVPQDGRHVLDNLSAAATAQHIMADPEQAPAQLKAMQAQWGSSWPAVWSDLTTIGKLPAPYQMVGALDNEGDGALLARALGSANKEGINKPIDDILDRGATGATRPSMAIRTRVEGSEAVQDYARSMLASGASSQQVQGIVSSIGLLGQAKALYHNEAPADAADHAVESAIGKYEFLPQGGARIPRANADAITDAAQRAVDGLQLSAVQPPAIYGATAKIPGAATADDWLRVTKAAPTWVTVGQSIRLMDNGGRFVRRPGGGFVSVPFNVAPAVAETTPTAATLPPPVALPF
jgi:hypothetical protein